MGFKCFTGQIKILPSAGLGIRASARLLRSLSLCFAIKAPALWPFGGYALLSGPPASFQVFEDVSESSCPPALSELHDEFLEGSGREELAGEYASGD